MAVLSYFPQNEQQSNGTAVHRLGDRLQREVSLKTCFPGNPRAPSYLNSRLLGYWAM